MTLLQEDVVTFEQVTAAAHFVRDRLNIVGNKTVACTGVILGSGLGDFADTLLEHPKSISISFGEIPHFPSTTIQGHKGRLVYSFIDGTPVLILQGRIHCYEGHSASRSAFPVRILAALGVTKLCITCATGGIRDEFNVGDLMLITDHINFTGRNPLYGPNDLRFGPRFLDLTEAYSKQLRTIAKEVARSIHITLHEGVYVGVLGPTYETPAEIRMYRTMGGDAVGMSTVPETIVARHNGLQVIGIASITNKASGLSEHHLSHEEVQEVAHQSGGRFGALLSKLLPEITKAP